MESVYLVLTGVTIGSVVTAVGSLLRAFVVRQTYTAITEPPEFRVKLNQDAEDNSRGLPIEAGAYDWDSYNQYVNAAEKDEEVPEA